MNGADTEVLTGGPEDDGPVLLATRSRSSWTLVVVAGLVGVLLGVVGTQLVTGDLRTGAGQAEPRPSTTTGVGPGVAVPEVLDAETLPGTGGMQVVAPAVAGASTPGPLRYDYELAGAVWLAPDGNVRTGRPDCGGSDPDAPQHLQVAVVHARAVAGGPNADRVVWYRCASQVAG
jgi:hypothetical protein